MAAAGATDQIRPCHRTFTPLDADPRSRRPDPLTALSRYVLRQHAGPFLLGLSLIVFVLVLDVVLQMMDQVISKGLGAGVALQLFVYNLAWIVALAVPMAVLVAVLMAFGRLAADNEILAVKSSGIGLMRLLWPVLGAAAVLTVLMVLFNDRVLPDWNHQARTIAANLKRRKAALVLKQKEGVFIRDVGGYSLLVHDVDEAANALRGIVLYDTHAPGAPVTLRAARGALEILEEGAYVRLTLEDGEYQRIDEDDPDRFYRGRFERQVVHIRDPQRALDQHQSTYRSDREMDVAAMLSAVADHRREARTAEAEMDSSVAAFVAAAAADTSTAAVADLGRQAADLTRRLEKARRLNDNRERRASAYLVEVHKKFSIAVACLVFVLLGAPLGVLVRGRGAAVSVAVSLAFFFAYWMFLIGGEELADRGFLSPALAMWAPNAIFGLLGGALLWATALDRSLFLRIRQLLGGVRPPAAAP
ncbi:MAG: LptF/LptG family permease [Gemmatimonadota bacterium]